MDARKHPLTARLCYFGGRGRGGGTCRPSELQDVTLHAIAKFAPSGAVTAPKGSQIAPFGDFIQALFVVNIGFPNEL